MQQQAVIEEVELGQESYPVCCIKPVPPSAVSAWQTLIEDFIRYDESIGRAAATIEGHKVSLRYWQRFLAEQKIGDLTAVTPQVVSDYQAWVYNYRTHFKRPFTLLSQIVILNNLQVFYQYLLKSGKILSNPAEVIRLPKEPRKLPAVILTPQEMKRLLAQPDTSTVLGFRDRTLYEVLYSTGIRIGELIRLRVQDLPGEVLTAAGIKTTETGPSGCLFVHVGKGGKDRVVPVGETAGKYLAEYLQRIRPVFRQASTTDVVFFNKASRQMEKSGIGGKLKLYAMRAGIKKKITVHTFRHTLATEMLKRGADIRQIQELLGHTNLRTTQIYTHIVKGDLRRVQEHCHPREQTELPEGFVNYRGRKYLTDEERKKDHRPRTRP
jgi:integrase/recombinase XerD